MTRVPMTADSDCRDCRGSGRTYNAWAPRDNRGKIQKVICTCVRAEPAPAPSPRPSCVPDGARWAWVTDGLGRRVEAWVRGACVHISDAPNSPWIWSSLDERRIFGGKKYPTLTPALAAQCRRLRDGSDPQDPVTGEVRLP